MVCDYSGLIVPSIGPLQWNKAIMIWNNMEDLYRGPLVQMVVILYNDYIGDCGKILVL